MDAEKAPNLGRYPKLLSGLLVISIAGLSLLFFYIYSEVSSRIRQDRQALMTETARGLAGHIDQWLDKNIRMLRTAAGQDAVAAMDPLGTRKILGSIQQEYPWIYLVFTLDRNGFNIARSDANPPMDYSDRTYFQKIRQGQSLAWQTLTGKTSHQPALVLAVPIFRNNEFSGVVAAAMTLDAVSQSVSDQRIGQSGFAYLLDETNQVIAHPDRDVVMKEKALATGIASLGEDTEKGPATPLGILKLTDQAGIAKIRTVRETHLGWRLILEQDEQEAFRALFRFQKFMVTVFASMVAMVLVIAWLFARISVSPVIRMIDAGRQREKDLEQRLQKVRKMEALGTFAGGIAHDFNNILGAITTCSEMAIEDVDEKDSVHEDLKHILKAAVRGKKLVKQILEYSRSRNTRHKPVKLHRILLEALDLFKTFKPDTLEIRLNIASKLDFILADSTQIHQVVMNLMLNAENAMAGQPGTLAITLARRDARDPGLPRGTELRPGSWLHLSVSDTGCGMDEHVLERMFDPYYTTHMNTGGTGLGLAMSEAIIHRHNGVITAESQVDRGSTFHIFLPCIGEPVAQTREERSEPVRLDGDAHILFVDDDEHMRYSGAKMLRRLGYRVTAAQNAGDALARFQNAPEQFDLVITDRVMPGKSGVELAHEVRQVRANIPIIMCSGFFNKKDDTFLDTAYDLDGLIDETVSKPFEITPMSRVIRRVLDRRKHG